MRHPPLLRGPQGGGGAWTHPWVLENNQSLAQWGYWRILCREGCWYTSEAKCWNHCQSHWVCATRNQVHKQLGQWTWRPNWALPLGTQLGQHAKEVWHPIEQGKYFLVDCQQSYHPQVGLKGLLVQYPQVHFVSSDGGQSLWIAPNSLQ